MCEDVQIGTTYIPKGALPVNYMVMSVICIEEMPIDQQDLWQLNPLPPWNIIRDHL